jgi:fructose-bisphosphate aldolase class II
MKKIDEYLREAGERGQAVGHFNISETAGLKAVAEAAGRLDPPSPIFIGLSEGERKFFGVRAAVVLVELLRKETGRPFFLNADHSHSLESAEEAAKAGFDAVLFDASRLPFEENIRETAEAVRRLKEINPDIVVEGELGKIPGESKIQENNFDLSEKELADPESAEAFVRETGIDLFAPAVGNIHGVLKNNEEPKIDFDRIAAIRSRVNSPLVLHGASGLSEPTLRKAVSAGIMIVHINTDLRLAWRQGLEKSLRDLPDEVAPYRLLDSSVRLMEERLAELLRIFRHSA